MPMNYAQIQTISGTTSSTDIRGSWIVEVRARLMKDGCSAIFVFDECTERDDFLAKFKKSAKVRAAELVSGTGIRPAATFHASTESTGVTGAVNEGGLRRLEGFLSVLAAIFPG